MADEPETATENQVIIREPTKADGFRLHELVRKVPPLSENSVYCNLLQCSQFSETCAVAEQNGELLGFVTGYVHPKQADTLFVWQVGVQERGRGRGLPLSMIRHILARPACRGITVLEATVGATNDASRAMFQALARSENARCEIHSGYFYPEHFGPNNKAPEDLFRIQPLSTPRNTTD